MPVTLIPRIRFSDLGSRLLLTGLLLQGRDLRRQHIATIVVFAFDLAEAAQRKRIDSLRAEGHCIRTVSFRRQNMPGRPLDSPNLDLGQMPNQRFLVRLWLLGRSVPRIFMARHFLADADVIIARNFDLLALAWITRRRGAHLIYECLDIHGLMTGDRPINRVMRCIERFLLRRSQLLWTSSPGFLTNYFEGIQNFQGPSVVIENKLWFGPSAPPRPSMAQFKDRNGSLVLGWVGSIRCQASFDILCTVAQEMPDTLRIEIHGNVHNHAVADFDARLRELDNVTYHGPYAYPDGLAGVYGRCDLVWAQDLWQRGGNSDWLLPNRIYEASWYGCPSVAVADTQTGQRVQELGLGRVIEAATTDDLRRCLQDLNRAKIRAMSECILMMEDDRFRLTSADIKNALAPVLGQ